MKNVDIFFHINIGHLTYKQNTNNKKKKKRYKTGRNQNSSLLLLVNSKKCFAKYILTRSNTCVANRKANLSELTEV